MANCHWRVSTHCDVLLCKPRCKQMVPLQKCGKVISFWWSFPGGLPRGCAFGEHYICEQSTIQMLIIMLIISQTLVDSWHKTLGLLSPVFKLSSVWRRAAWRKGFQQKGILAYFSSLEHNTANVVIPKNTKVVVRTVLYWTLPFQTAGRVVC